MILEAAERHGHAFADIHSRTARLPFREYLHTFGDDWFHPNAKGYAIWADAVWEPMSQ